MYFLEYEYYHDEDCNEATVAVTDDPNIKCDENLPLVCGLPKDPCGRLTTFTSYCDLQKHNCNHSDHGKTISFLLPITFVTTRLQFFSEIYYFHEGVCYTDEDI